MHYAGCLVDSDALKLGMCDLALKFLNSLCQKFWIFAKIFRLIYAKFWCFQYLSTLHAYLCHKHYFSFIPILYCFERQSTRYIGKCGLLAKIWKPLGVISTKYTLHLTTYTTAREANMCDPKQTSSDAWWTWTERLTSRLEKIHALHWTPCMRQCTKIRYKWCCAKVFEWFALKFFRIICAKF